MRVLQQQYSTIGGWDGALRGLAENNVQLAIVFGSVEHFSAPGFAEALADGLPGASVVGCTTAGEITRDGVAGKTCVITGVTFARTQVKVAEAVAVTSDDSFSAGAKLGEQLAGPGLAAVIVLGKGVAINGSALIDGIVSKIGAEVPLSGGLAGDDGAFQRTLILSPSGVYDDRVVAVGLYGEALGLGYGSFGGWEPFGPTRKITRAEGNILYELDGEPALNIYKRYLGEYAKDLPASGLLFPFEMLDKDHDAVGLIRTILAVNEAEGSLVLAGALVEDGYLRLMHASNDALVNGAENAASAALDALGGDKASLALLVSCVGRKLVMGDQIDDEIDTVAELLGDQAVLAGFYSYGEISPLRGSTDCKLHNQTMTVTVLTER